MEMSTYKPYLTGPSRLLTSFWGDNPFEGLGNTACQCIPALNVHETHSHYEISIAAPGLKKENFSLTEENGLLRIQCQTESKEKESEALHEEFHYMNWSRSIQLPKNQITANKIKASYQNGVLQVQIPKRKEALSSQKTISVD